MSEKVERRAENGAGGTVGAAGGVEGSGAGVVDINCHEPGAFSVPLISKVGRSK